MWVWVLALTVLALALRLPGISFQLPHVPGVDEQVIYVQLRAERGWIVPPYKSHIPNCYTTLIARVADVVLPGKTDATPRTTAEHLAVASRDLLGLRVLLACLSVAVVPLTFLLARRFLSPFAALVASAFAATSVLHAWYAVQARPHATLAAATLIAVLGALALRRQGGARGYIIAGLAAALATGWLQSGVLAVPALWAAHLLRERRRPRDWVWFALAHAPVLLAFLLFYPTPPEPTGFVESSNYFLRLHRARVEQFNGAGFGAIVRAWRDYDPLIAALAATGVIVWSARWLVTKSRPRSLSDLAVVLAHAVSHALVFGMFDHTWQRFTLPLIPYLAISAAFAVDAIARGLVLLPGLPLGFARALVAAVFLVPQAFVCAKLAFLRLTPDTLTQTADWLREHSEPGKTRIALSPGFELPLLRTEDTLSTYLIEDRMNFHPWLEYQLALAPEARSEIALSIRDVRIRDQKEFDLLERDPIQFAAPIEANYAVVEVVYGGRRPFFESLRVGMRARGRLVAHFAPSDERDVEPILYNLDGWLAPEQWFAWRALHAERLGPEVEVYRIDR